MILYLQNICEGMASEEENNEKRKIDSIRSIIQEIVQLSQDLSVEPSVESYVERHDVTLTEQETELLEKVEVLRKEKSIRMARYDFLRGQEAVLCNDLDEPPAVIPFSGIPHDDQVSSFSST